MEHKAFYKDIGNIGYSTTVLYFKIDDEIFSISFGCYFKPKRKQKFMGNKLLKRMVLSAKYIGICDHLSKYVFDSGYGRVVDISENKRLVDVVLNMRKELHKRKYKKMNGKDPIEMKPRLLVELYTNVWK
jgi:hypothetical protein